MFSNPWLSQNVHHTSHHRQGKQTGHIICTIEVFTFNWIFHLQLYLSFSIEFFTCLETVLLAVASQPRRQAVTTEVSQEVLRWVTNDYSRPGMLVDRQEFPAMWMRKICKTSKTAVSSLVAEFCYREDKRKPSFCQFTTWKVNSRCLSIVLQR